MNETIIERLKLRAARLKTEIHAIVLAYRDPRVPWYAKALAAGVVAYALSPLDLIPDFIPVLGYLDDVILLPIGIALVLKLIPPDVLAECRQRAEEKAGADQPKSTAAAVIIIAVWLLLLALAVVGIMAWIDRPLF